MFPLVPDLISNEMNLIVALLIGIAFGFILEQAGFSSSRKLAGLFFGYDFTVLRVFFTAGVTAMSGVIIFGYLGWLDADFIYINPTYLESAILGGVIMGFGFIIGGYCPGTSVCAAAIGKIDAMFFVGGGLIGVFIFAEGYPMFEEIYHASYLGDLRIFNSLGMSEGIFALLLIVVAVGAFIATTQIEKKVNADGPAKEFHPIKHRLAGSGIVLLGIVLVFLPDRKERLMNEVSRDSYINSHSVKEMTSDEFAFRLLDNDHHMQIVDVREGKEFADTPFPKAVNIQVDQIFKKEYTNVFGLKHQKKIFIANDERSEKEAALIAQEVGYENLYVLKGGLNVFNSIILHYTKPAVMTTRDEIDSNRFRAKASVEVSEMMKAAKEKPVKVPKLIKKIAGGC